MTDIIRFDHPLVVQGLSVVREYPNGISRTELAALMGVEPNKASQVLYCLRHMGLIKFHKPSWFVTKPNKEVVEAGKQEILEKLRCRSVRRNALKKEARAAIRAQKAGEANKPPKNPFVVNAPNSVWQLQYFV